MSLHRRKNHALPPMRSTFDGVVTSIPERVAVKVTFTFDPEFPVAFNVLFETEGDHPAEWTVGRDLVSEALMNSCAGLGDVGMSIRSGDAFVIDLRAEGEYAQVTVSRSLVEAFFVASERMVPATSEAAWLADWSASTMARLAGAA